VADEGLDTAAFQREIPSVVASLNTILTADTPA
jgi:hypothetical protein